LKILVTGGAGFVGSHTCKALALAGYEPIVYDNLSRGHRSAVKWGPLEQGDIADSTRIRNVLEQYRPCAVMHFAAYAYVGESVQSPFLYYKNNVAGTIALLSAIIDFASIPMVFSSTCATYGVPQQLPISEDHPQNPITPYGRSKLMVECMLRDADTAHGLRSVSLRYFNAAGSDPECEVGEMHEPETHLIPLILRAARDGTPVRIFGTDYETPDGTCIRDYVHVSDLATAHVSAMGHLLAGNQSCACNLANARGHSVKQVIEIAEKISGKPIKTETAHRRIGDPPVLIGSSVRAEQLLGWKATYSDLQTQIRDAWRWIKSMNSSAPDDVGCSDLTRASDN
jgi:UDP-glucose-4-epimerase GalE